MHITSPLKLFLLGTMGLIAILTLGSDFFSLIQMKKNEQNLQQIQVKKENMLTKKMETSPQPNQLAFLNQSEAGFILAKLCDTSQLLLTKIQLGKSAAKITQNTFDVSLNLMSDYFGFIAFFNQLTDLAWNIDWQTLHINVGNTKTMKKTKHQMGKQMSDLYPLEIKLKLAIRHHYSPTKKIPQPIAKSTNAGYSPFIMRSHAGTLIENGKITDLVIVGETMLSSVS